MRSAEAVTLLGAPSGVWPERSALAWRRSWALRELARLICEDSRRLVAESERLVAVTRRRALRVATGGAP